MGYLHRTGGPEPLFICIQTLKLKKELLAPERGFICQNEVDGPLFCPYNIDFWTEHPKIDLFTKFRKFPFRGTIPSFSVWLFLLSDKTSA